MRYAYSICWEFDLTSNFDFCPSLSLVRFLNPITLLRYADKRIVNNYNERVNL